MFFALPLIDFGFCAALRYLSDFLNLPGSNDIAYRPDLTRNCDFADRVQNSWRLGFETPTILFFFLRIVPNIEGFES